ncbi:MAG: guanylate kinase [Alphaproteobacteria bacterium]|nr:guanylate kinase [Alphaproteobacteria bacterium]
MTDILEQLDEVRRGVMFVIEAPSGTGKTTVIRKLLAEDEDLKFSVSVTTRQRREGEVDGVDYQYVSDAEYDKLLAEDAFYETVDSLYGCRYGTLRSEVDGFLNVGQDVIFDMDWLGLEQMKAKAPQDVVSIYLLPPSIKELRRRLEGRHTDSIEKINKRMGLVLEKMAHWTEYDYVIVCLNPEQATDTLKKIIAAERLKRVRQTGLKDFTQKLIDEVNLG